MVLINDIHINIWVTGVSCNIWLSWRDFCHILNNTFCFVACQFFLQLASHLLPNLLPPNSPYNLNTCSTAL